MLFCLITIVEDVVCSMVAIATVVDTHTCIQTIHMNHHTHTIYTYIVINSWKTGTQSASLIMKDTYYSHTHTAMLLCGKEA